MIKSISIFILALSISLGLKAQVPAPGPEQTAPIAIIKGTAHIGNGEVVENSVVLFTNGKIESVGVYNATFDYSLYKIIDATGKDIYPGLILPLTKLGLEEVAAVRATRDDSEVGSIKPHIRSAIAFNTDSEIIPTMKFNGIQIAQIAPVGGRIEGTSSIMQLDAWNWEDATVKTDDAVHMNWPSSFKRGRWWMGEDAALKPNDKYKRDIDAFVSFMENAKVYRAALAKEKNRPYEATQGLFSGSQKLFITANGEKEIIDAVTTAKQLGVKHVVLVGGAASYKITDFLMKNQIPVLVEGTHNLPGSDDSDYDQPYKLPKLLTDAGILVSIQNSDAANFQNRNLPFYAGQVVGQGMDKETALSLITLNAAKILGIDQEFGSLEVGKSATLFISKGDALDMRTNEVQAAFIQGREISLETHQTELWKRYMGKFERQ